jgi:transposase
VIEAVENVQMVAEVVQPESDSKSEELVEVVTDKGYHSREVVRDLSEAGVRTYISEPERGPQKWNGQEAEQAAVYANRRRIRGERGKGLQRQRGEKLERVNAHLYETGGMRRTHLRGHPNILKRLLIHVCGLNLGVLLRASFGIGTPRGLQGRTRQGLIESQIFLIWLFCHGRCNNPHSAG